MNEDQSVTIEDISGAPYIFTIKNNVKLELDEWTIDAEIWAKKHYGSMQKLFNNLMKIGCEDQDTIDTTIAVACYKLTDRSRSTLKDLRGEMPEEEFLMRNVTYKHLAGLARAAFEMIRDSIPIEALKKNPMTTNAMHTTTTK